MKRLFWIVWLFSLVFCVAHYLYALNHNFDTELINIEHTFYLNVICMSAISMSNLKYGKILLFLFFCLNLGCLYALPEMEKISVLKDCAEGRCQLAEKLGYIKISDGKIEYLKDNIEQN